MNLPAAQRLPVVRILAALALAAVITSGCIEKKAPKPTVRYATLPAKQVPAFLKDTIYERVDLVDAEALPLSGYGVVSRPKGTGDNKQLASVVRTFIVK